MASVSNNLWPPNPRGKLVVKNGANAVIGFMDEAPKISLASLKGFTLFLDTVRVCLMKLGCHFLVQIVSDF
jgi:hypothetical protein